MVLLLRRDKDLRYTEFLSCMKKTSLSVNAGMARMHLGHRRGMQEHLKATPTAVACYELSQRYFCIATAK